MTLYFHFNIFRTTKNVSEQRHLSGELIYFWDFWLWTPYSKCGYTLIHTNKLWQLYLLTWLANTLLYQISFCCIIKASGISELCETFAYHWALVLYSKQFFEFPTKSLLHLFRFPDLNSIQVLWSTSYSIDLFSF